MITAAALCPAPPLLARPVTGIDPVVPQLRQACLDATAALLSTEPDQVTVVGVDQQTRHWDQQGRLNLSAYAPAIGDAGDGTGLPLSVGLGNLLLDQAGYSGQRELISVGEDEPAANCATLGAMLAGAGGRAALLVMADGSARRGPKAPGYLDERSFRFDAEVERAIRTGDLAALLALDMDLARELMVTGRPALQVLAGAMDARRIVSQIRYCDDPFGVAYLVASLTAC